MTDAKQEIAQLRAELDKVKASLAPKPFDPAEVGRWQDQMHQLAERRMARASVFSSEDLAAMEAACPTDVCQDIVARGAVRGPSGHGVGSTVSAPSGVYPNMSGWRDATPIGPPPGVAQADRLMDAQDARDRHDLIVEEARRVAARKLAEGSK
jgi:hypothetical protein